MRQDYSGWMRGAWGRLVADEVATLSTRHNLNAERERHRQSGDGRAAIGGLVWCCYWLINSLAVWPLI